MGQRQKSDFEANNFARMVFRGSHLIDGTNPPRSEMTVVVRGERIESVVADDAFTPLAGDRVFDLAGASLMPGMVQGHFHSHFGAFGDGVRAPALGLEAAPAYLSMLAAYNAELAVQAGFRELFRLKHLSILA